MACLGVHRVRAVGRHTPTSTATTGSTRRRSSAPRSTSRADAPGRATGACPSCARGSCAPVQGVSLTFDDGPDPRWTPAVLEALEAGACARRSSSSRRAPRPPGPRRPGPRRPRPRRRSCTATRTSATATSTAARAPTTPGARSRVGAARLIRPSGWRAPWGVRRPARPTRRPRAPGCGWTGGTSTPTTGAATRPGDARRGRGRTCAGAVVLAHDGARARRAARRLRRDGALVGLLGAAARAGLTAACVRAAGERRGRPTHRGARRRADRRRRGGGRARPRPAFPADAIGALDAAGARGRPAFAAELVVVRARRRADGSVGRIVDGHLNAVERLASTAPESAARARARCAPSPRTACSSASGAPTRGPARASRRGSAAAGLALGRRRRSAPAPAACTARSSWPAAPTAGCSSYVDLRGPASRSTATWFRGHGDARVGEPPRRLRRRAVLAVLGGPGELVQRAVVRARRAADRGARGPGWPTPPADAARAALAARRASGDELDRLAAGRIGAERGTIDLLARRGRAPRRRRPGASLRTLSRPRPRRHRAAARALCSTRPARACGSRPFVTGGGARPRAPRPRALPAPAPPRPARGARPAREAAGERGEAALGDRLRARSTAAEPGPVGLRDERVRAREVRRRRSRRCGDRRFARGLELGCSIGVLTGALAAALRRRSSPSTSRDGGGRRRARAWRGARRRCAARRRCPRSCPAGRSTSSSPARSSTTSTRDAGRRAARPAWRSGCARAACCSRSTGGPPTRDLPAARRRGPRAPARGTAACAGAAGSAGSATCSTSWSATA